MPVRFIHVEPRHVNPENMKVTRLCAKTLLSFSGDRRGSLTANQCKLDTDMLGWLTPLREQYRNHLLNQVCGIEPCPLDPYPSPNTSREPFNKNHPAEDYESDMVEPGKN